MGLRVRLLVVISALVAITVAPLIAQGQSGQYELSHPDFVDVWDRTDLPVQQGQVNRTWMWGPGANTPLLQEAYAEAEGGTRTVQYTDKSRMELPVHDVPPDSDWFITQGLLATELMTGNLQLGDATFEQHPPADIYVAGDPANNQSPTYAQMGELIDRPTRTGGNVITEVLTSDGAIENDPFLDMFGVWDAYYVDATGNHIASVFWDFMNSTGTVYENGQFVEGDVFTNPFYAIGFPITDAFWGNVTVAGQPQEVLIQCFERRCLTFAPLNDPGWEVESGNIGQHYYDWRYEHISDPVNDGTTDDTPPPSSDDTPPSTDDDSVDIPVPDRFELSPDTTTSGTLGERVDITLTVFDQFNAPYQGTTVTAWVTNGLHEDVFLDQSSHSTSSDGTMTLGYVGTRTDSPGGSDTVQVEVAGIDEPQTILVVWTAPPEESGCVQPGQSIQAAIDAAEGEEVVCIEAGVYHESILISKDNATVSAEDGVVLDGSEVNATRGVRITGDNVTLRDIQVRNFSDVGVSVSGVDRARLQRVDLVDNQNYQLLIQDSHRVSYQESSVEIDFDDAQGASAVLVVSSTETNLSELSIEGGWAGVRFMRFDLADPFSSGRVAESSIRSWNHGVVADGVEDLAVRSNSIENSQAGVELAGDLGTGIVVDRNRIEAEHAGVLIEGSFPATLTENRILGGQNGIQVNASGMVDILNNRISDADTGILATFNADGSLLTAMHNDIMNNSRGVVVENVAQTGHAMFARFNYWGDPSGPSGEGPGLGDSISEHVNADYWEDDLVNPGLAP
jgi:nitrous oxidase accessory protein NosD